MSVCPSCQTTDYAEAIKVPEVYPGIAFWSCANCDVDFHELPPYDGWRLRLETYARNNGINIVQGMKEEDVFIPKSRLDKAPAFDKRPPN